MKKRLFLKTALLPILSKIIPKTIIKDNRLNVTNILGIDILHKKELTNTQVRKIEEAILQKDNIVRFRNLIIKLK